MRIVETQFHEDVEQSYYCVFYISCKEGRKVWKVKRYSHMSSEYTDDVANWLELAVVPGE